ncbi:MAG: peptidoglycan DD-metalloendopeptidase family protein [Pseudomonadota bacterium]
MRTANAIFLASCAGLLAACAGKSEAPVVYGSQPTWQGRIYGSADDLPPAPAAETSRDAGAVKTTAVDEADLLGDLIEPDAVRGRKGRRVASANLGAMEEIYLESTLEGGGSGGSGARPQIVRVRSGDTVYAIARRAGADPQAVIALNGLRAPYSLSVGQPLQVPSNGRTVADLPSPEPRSSRGATRSTPASSTSRTQPTLRRHVVRAGDTLYSISRVNGLSVREVASANGLRAPYTLSIGDELTIPGGARTAAKAPGAKTPRATANAKTRSRPSPSKIVKAPPPANKKPVREASLTSVAPQSEPAVTVKPIFEWPVKGAVIEKFRRGAPGERNDGIDIAAPVGTPVRASADGEVVYRGAGLEGYGNLLLVKHDDGFVTAYAHNDVMLVRKGQRVRQGQVIAKVGQTGGADQPQLHFEIRQNLKAVDPIALLGS